MISLAAAVHLSAVNYNQALAAAGARATFLPPTPHTIFFWSQIIFHRKHTFFLRAVFLHSLQLAQLVFGINQPTKTSTERAP